MPRTQIRCGDNHRRLDIPVPGMGLRFAPLATALSTDGALSLSAQLRARTNPLHRQTEQVLGLPGAIRTPQDYLGCLGRFLGLYEPLERTLAGFPEWGAFGIALTTRAHSPCIIRDLAALGADPAGVERTPQALLPHLPTFAHALGALYVLEGATLGGRLILRDLETRIGPQITGATRFFGGRGEAAGTMWQNFRAALDAFGLDRPQLHADVVSGAERVFRAILARVGPFHAEAGEQT